MVNGSSVLEQKLDRRYMKSRQENRIDYLAPVRLNIGVLRFFGAWITPESSIVYTIVGHTILMVFKLGFAVSALLSVPELRGLDETMSNISIALTLVGYTIKFLNLFLKRYKIKEFFEELNSSMNQYPDQKARDIMNARIKSAKRIIRGQFIIFVLGGSSSMYTIFSPQHRPAYQLYFPDWRNSKASLYVNIVYQSFGTTAGAICNVSIDAFVPYLLLLLGAHVDVLVLQLNELAKEKGFNKNKRQLMVCVEKHRALLRMAARIEEIFSTATFVQILLSGVINCGLLFVLSTTSPTQQTGTFYMNTVFVSGMLLQIFIPCYAANVVKYRSEALKDSVFNSNWIDTELGYKKMILFFMLRLNSPVVINAGGAFTLGLEVFTKISNFTYSSFTLLRRINSKIH